MRRIVAALVSVVAIASLTFLSYTALQQGIDGAVFATVTALVAGLGGYQIREMTK